MDHANDEGTARTRGVSMRCLALLVLDTWCYARWLLLKATAVLLHALHRSISLPRAPELWAIRFGNLLYPQRWPATLFDSYEDYDRGYPADLRPYAQLVGQADIAQAKEILDLGCGLGSYSRALALAGARQVVGVEYQFAKARFAQRRSVAGVVIVNASAMHLPFRAASFDLVFSNTVFEHLPGVDAALAEIARVLQPGGRALIGFNFFHHRGGHHLFPYVRFPWPTWVVSERAACAYWTSRLRADQLRGRMNFYATDSWVESLAQGAEISLNRWTYEQFERAVQSARLQIERRIPSETIARLFPGFVAALPIRRFLTGTVFYALRHTHA